MNYVALVLLLASSLAAAEQATYDPMADLVSDAKREINATEAISKSKARANNDPRRKKVDAGFWQFFQGKREARRGEFCTAVYWRRDKMIAISGPGGGYGGAMLSFIAIEPPEGFPRPDNSRATQKIKVTLTQGSEAPATVTALNSTIAGMADEIKFAVPTIDAALAGMEDALRFRIDYEGREVFNLDWHSGLAARSMLKRCLSGENIEGSEIP